MNSHASGPRPSPRLRGKRPAPRGSWQRWIAPDRIWWVLTAGVLIVGLLYLMRSLLAILFASLALAYLMDPLVDRFEARGWKRETGIGALAALAALLVVTTLGVVIPSVAIEFQGLSDNFGSYISQSFEELAHQRHELEARFGVELPENIGYLFDELEHQLLNHEVAVEIESGASEERDIAGLLDDAAPNLGAWISQVLSSAVHGGANFLVGLLNVCLVPIFVFYLLRDWDRLVLGIDEMIPPRHRPLVRKVVIEIDGRVASFVRGQITICLILGVLYSIGLLISGIDLAIVVGMGSGLLFIVPYLGTAVGVVLAAILALMKFGFGWQLLVAVGTFGVVQLLEGMLITPKVMGEQVGLHPLVVMIALLVGGNLLGLWGMLVAIPLTAAAQVLLLEWYRGYRASRFFGGGVG